MLIEELAKRGTEAVKKLRHQKLSNGEFFMINMDDLPEGQCYIEYADGSMMLAALSSTENDFDVIRKLSIAESDSIRRQNELF